MFARLSPSEQHSLLEDLAADAGCTLDEIKVELAYRWEGWFARPTQLEPPGDWLYWLLKAGRGYGKTRIGAEWTRKKAKTCRRLHLIAPTAADYRDVMINGESGLMEISPRHERPVFYPSKRLLVWPNGSQALLFSGEDPESLRGPQCEALWADEIAAWQYPQETWDMALLGLRLGDDPQACITSTPKPIGVYRDLVNDVDCVVTGGSTYENLANLSRTYRTIINRYEGTNLGRQELHAELLENEGLAYRFSERLHVLRPVRDLAGLGPLRAHGLRPLGRDRLVRRRSRPRRQPHHLRRPLRRRPSVRHRPADPREARRLLGSRPQRQTDPEPVPRRPGRVRARQADQVGPRAGRQRRVLRARHPPDSGVERPRPRLRPDQRAPQRARDAAVPRLASACGEPGAPQLYILDVPGTLELREQLQDAPLEEDGKPHPGEAVDRDWERSKGHAHASLRYGSVSKPKPSKRPQHPDLLAPAADPDELRRERLRKTEEKRNKPAGGAGRYRNV
jgi:hypothetical protein